METPRMSQGLSAKESLEEFPRARGIKAFDFSGCSVCGLGERSVAEDEFRLASVELETSSREPSY